MSKVASNNPAKMERRRRSAAATAAAVSRSSVMMRPRTATPSKQTDKINRRRSGSVIPMDRISMLVMEANEISQCLGKNYHFVKNVEVPGDEEQTTITVFNRNLSMSCLWSLSKLKEKLLLMRKLVYAGDSAGSGVSSEAVFYDPKDDWKKEPISAMYFDMSPETAGTNAIDAAVADLQQQPLNNPRAPDVSRSSSHRNLSGSRSFNGLSTGSSTSSELPAESDFIPTSSETGPARHIESVLPQKYFISNPQDEQLQLDRSSSNNSTPLASPTHNSKLPVISTSSHGYGVPSHPKKLHLTPRKRHVDAGIQTENVKSEKKSHVSLLTLCKEMVSMTMDRLRRQVEKEEANETIIDQILTSCESVKMAVVNILEAYTRSQQLGSSGTAFTDSDLVRVLSMQLVASLELVVSLTAVWTTMYNNTSSPSLTNITQSINSSINELATEILVFLQACETGTEDEAHSASNQIMELLSQLVRLCGQLALVTDICPVTLYSPTSDSIDNMSVNSNKDSDLVHMEPSSDLKQMFLQGADTFLDETLENSLQAIECSEMAAESLSPDDKGASKCEANSEVLKHVYITVATSKLLVLKTQQIQVELDSELREDHYRSEQYYLFFYKRCQSLLVYITRLSDNISLLVQAAQPLANDSQPDPGALMKVCRCSELIQRNAQKLIRTPVSDERKQNLDNSINQSVVSSLNGLSLDLSSLNSCESMASLVLSSKHLTELESSGDDVLLATKALIDLCRRELLPFKGTNYKVKRMLPVTPSGVRPVPRCRSARSAEQRSLSRNLSEADISQDTQD